MTVDEYLKQAPEPQRTTLNQIRSTLRELLPEATEAIAYGMPAFKVGGKAVAGFAAYKAHCSYFPHSGDVLSGIANELEGYEWSKGTLKFPVDQPLPKDLIALLVEAKLRELEAS